MNPSKFVPIATVLATLAGAPSTRAAHVTLQFTATVWTQHDDFGLLPGVSVGSVVRGLITYDDSTPDYDTSASWGAYPFASPQVSDTRPGRIELFVAGLHFRLGNYDCEPSVDCGTSVFIEHDGAPYTDDWLYQAYRDNHVGGLIDLFDVDFRGLDMLTSDALVVPTLAGANKSAEVYFTPRDERSSLIPRYSEFQAHITSLSATSCETPEDVDCDGIPDATDRCPFLAGDDQNADTDGDGRGDACECSDQNGDGRNTVADLVAINAAIFNPALVTPLCDGNNDGLCNINDIIAANREIFVPKSSICARQPVPGP